MADSEIFQGVLAHPFRDHPGSSSLHARKGKRLICELAVAVLLFVSAEAEGANWCRGNYSHSQSINSGYHNDYYAANGGIWLIKTVRYIVHENREDLVASGTIVLAIFTIGLVFAARGQQSYS